MILAIRAENSIKKTNPEYSVTDIMKYLKVGNIHQSSRVIDKARKVFSTDLSDEVLKDLVSSHTCDAIGSVFEKVYFLREFDIKYQEHILMTMYPQMRKCMEEHDSLFPWPFRAYLSYVKAKGLEVELALPLFDKKNFCQGW